MQAMILAAGFGTRLKPYSLVRPKPLFPVLNVPLLTATIRRLRNAGFSAITVNCHYLREQVRELLEPIEGVKLSEEAEILGTGGGLRHVLRNFADEPVLVVNGDIYHTIDLGSVYRHHLQSDGRVTMVLHDCKRYNNVQVSANRIVGFNTGDRKCPSLAYTGIQVINPDVIAGISAGRYSCIIDHYRKMPSADFIIRPLVIEHTGWTDMGTPEDYLDLHRQLLNGKRAVWRELPNPDESSPFIVDRGAEIGRNVELQEWACVGAAVIGDNTVIRRSVIWEGSVVPPGSVISDRIVIPGGN